MTSEEIKIPFYAKATILFIGTIALFAILYIAKTIIVPVVFATIIAILLSPVVGFFVKIGINRVVAIAITLLLTFLIIIAFGSLLISQAVRFSESLPVLVDKFTGIINQTINDASGYFEWDPQKIHAWITKTQGEIINISTAAIGQSLVIAGSVLIVLFLLPVYVFLILFYQPLLLEFIWRLFGEDNQSQVKEIVIQIKTVIQRYLTGLVIEAVIIAILNTAALLILGIEYALIIGILGALAQRYPVHRRACCSCNTNGSCTGHQIVTRVCLVCYGCLLFHPADRQ